MVKGIENNNLQMRVTSWLLGCAASTWLRWGCFWNPGPAEFWIRKVPGDTCVGLEGASEAGPLGLWSSHSWMHWQTNEEVVVDCPCLGSPPLQTQPFLLGAGPGRPKHQAQHPTCLGGCTDRTSQGPFHQVPLQVLDAPTPRMHWFTTTSLVRPSLPQLHPQFIQSSSWNKFFIASPSSSGPPQALTDTLLQ